jgi:hypothetical protein
MTIRHALLTLLAAGHLTLVACGAFGLTPLAPKSPVAKLQDLYGELSGANNGYGFYAPTVASEHRAVFELTDEDGETWTDSLMTGASFESAIRLQNIVQTSVELQAESESNADDAEFHWMDRIAFLWADAMLKRHPSAVEVEVKLEVFFVVPMAEYRAGVRPKWEVVYQDRFTRKKEPRGDSDRKP